MCKGKALIVYYLHNVFNDYLISQPWRTFVGKNTFYTAKFLNSKFIAKQSTKKQKLATKKLITITWWHLPTPSIACNFIMSSCSSYIVCDKMWCKRPFWNFVVWVDGALLHRNNFLLEGWAFQSTCSALACYVCFWNAHFYSLNKIKMGCY
jgi:hypothetical protein